MVTGHRSPEHPELRDPLASIDQVIDQVQPQPEQQPQPERQGIGER